MKQYVFEIVLASVLIVFLEAVLSVTWFVTLCLAIMYSDYTYAWLGCMVLFIRTCVAAACLHMKFKK